MLESNGSDLQIVRPDYSAGSFKLSANFSTASRAIVIERK